jgi:hypothetical protein
MKKTLLLLVISLNSFMAYGQGFEIQPFTELVSEIENAEFSYKETGLLFGFSSIKSCMYASRDIVIFKNYCSPRNNFPARGYTIISAKFGMIDIYEEKIDAIIKRDITQTEFSQNLAPYLTMALPTATLDGMNEIMETLYSQYNPGCWSTNWSHYSRLPEASCSSAAGEVIGFKSWTQETQSLTGNDQEWNGLIQTIENQLSL